MKRERGRMREGGLKRSRFHLLANDSVTNSLKGDGK